MTEFNEKASQQFQDITDLFERMTKVYEEVVVSFGEDPKAMSPEEFFGLFRNFMQSLDVS